MARHELTRVAVVDILKQRNPPTADGTCYRQTQGVIDIGTPLPPKWQYPKRKVPAGPLKPKEGRTRRMEGNMLVPIFVINDHLEMSWKDIPWQIRDIIKLKR